MSETAEPQARRRCPLWVKILLVLSLAINLAVAGLVAGVVLRGTGPLRGGGLGVAYAMPYVVGMDRADRRAVFAALRRSGDLPDRAQRQAAFSEMLLLLRADLFDRGAAEAVLDRQAQGAAQVQRAAQAAWLDRVETMDAATRIAYADQVAEVLRRGPRRGEGPSRKP